MRLQGLIKIGQFKGIKSLDKKSLFNLSGHHRAHLSQIFNLSVDICVAFLRKFLEQLELVPAPNI